MPMSERKIGNEKPSTNIRGDGIIEPLGKQWLFGIGIGKYAELPNLANAVKDVKDIIQVLTKDYGVSPSNTITLFNEEANRENLIHRLDQLAEKVGKDDTLLVYFAGHGYLNNTTDMGYWIPHDSKKGRTSLYINNSTIRDYIKAIKSKHTLLIADSCFSGSFFVRGTRRSSIALQKLESIPSRWAICSGRHDQVVDDGVPGENSPFAQSIIETLRDNTEELFNVTKLVDRVVEQTGNNNEQLPRGKPIQGVGDMGGEYVFHRTGREEIFWEECQRKDHIQIYSQYLGQFPVGKHRSVALARMKELEDEDKVAWRRADKSDNISALYDYIDQHGFGQHVKEALEKIKVLEKQEENVLNWSIAKIQPKKIFDPLIPKANFLKRRPILRTIFGVGGMIIYMFSMIWFIFWNVPILQWLNTSGSGFLIFIIGTLFLYLWYSSWDKKNENHTMIIVLKALFLSWLVISTIIFIISAIFNVPILSWLNNIWLQNFFAAVSSFIWFRAFSRLK